ncbi:MAG: phosphopantetheine adenylyltransferase [Pseudomonadota bacterium]
MRHVVSAMLIIVGIIHLLPLSGILGSDRLAALYGLSFTDPNLAILMRHRAVLFGLLGVFLIFAAFRPALQTLAFIAGFISVASFLWLAWSVGGYNAQIARVFMADIVALVCLTIGVAAHAYLKTRS